MVPANAPLAALRAALLLVPTQGLVQHLPPAQPRPARLAAPLAEPPRLPPGAPSDPGPCDEAPDEPDFLHLATGELTYAAVDLRIRGRGLDFLWARRYRSRTGPDTAQGNGWDFSYDIRIEAAGQHVLVHDGNGRSDPFRLQPDGSFAADGFFQEGRFETSGTFELVFADGGTWRFHPLDGSPRAGRIQSSSDRSGNTLLFDYDALGRLVLVTDTLGRPITIAYDSAGMIASVTDFRQRSVVYTYASGSLGLGRDLASATSPAVVGTPTGNDFPLGKTTTYAYTQGFADERLNHNLLSITDPKGQTWLASTYAATEEPSDLDFDRVQRVVLGGSEILDIVYVQPQPEPPLPPETVLEAIVNDAAGNVEEFFFDAANRCLVRREYTGRAAADQPTTPTANRPSGPLRPGDPPFFESRWEWNQDSRPTRITRPNGNLIERVHERELDPAAPPRSRGNLRLLRRLPGPLGGDPPEIVELFEYDQSHGGCCGSNFVTRATGPRGDVTEHSYDAAGNRTQTRHPIAGIVEDFEYDAFGQRTRHLHPDNGAGCRRDDRWVYYGPSAGFQNGYLAQEIVDAGASAMTTTYEVDAVGNAVRVVDPLGHDDLFVFNALDQVVRSISRPVDPGGVRYEIDTIYDADDNVVRRDVLAVDHLGQIEPNSHLTTSEEYDLRNRPVRRIQEVDATRSIITEWQYDANGNRTLERRGEAVNGHQPGNVVRRVFDERDLLFWKICAEGDPAQSTEQQDYDGNRNCIRRLEGLEDGAHEELFGFDGYDRQILSVDPMGNDESRCYDAAGNVVLVQVRGELADQPGSSGNVLLHEAVQVFDALDRMIWSEVDHFDPATQVAIGDGLSITQYEYSGTSQVVRTTDDNGRVRLAAYDCAGRKALEVDAAGNTLGYTYDANSNATQIVQVDRSDLTTGVQTFVTTRTYDSLGRLVQNVDALGNATVHAYDSRDNLRLDIDQRGNRTEHAYDGLDRLLTTTRFLTTTGTGSGSPAGTIPTSQAWDDSSRLVEQTDPNGNITHYAYDACDRLVATTYADGTLSSSAWDAHGSRVETTDPNGTVVTLAHDLDDRLASKTVAPGPGVSDDTTFEAFQYDGRSRRVLAQDDDSLVLRRYDSLSNTIHVEENGRSSSASFDGVGNRLGLTYPGGRTLSFTHDSLNRKRTIVDGTLLLAQYAYLGRRVERRTFPAGGVTTDYLYDGLRRLARSTTHAGANLVDDRAYAWDAMDNRVQRTDLRPGGPRWTHTYAYDSASRLRHATVTAPPPQGLVRDTDYALDPAGNRVSTAGDLCPGTYAMSTQAPEPADRAVNQYTQTPCDQRTYDRNGNLIASIPSQGSPIQLAYDYADRLVAIDYGPSGLDTYAYDGLGRRIARVLQAPTITLTTLYLYDGWQVIEERNASQQVLATYVWGDGQDEILSMRRNGADTFYHADSLGSVTAATNATGAVVERYEYHDFGWPSFSTGSGTPISASAIGNPHLFAGARYDASSLYWLRNRYLDPRSGRFLTRDPIGMWEDLGNLGNGLSYAANGPQTRVDPLGLAWEHSINQRCHGPWPGPRTLHLDFDDCSRSRRYLVSDASCVGFRAAGQAYADLKRLVQFYEGDLDDVDWGDLATELAVNRWFGGPDGDTSLNSKDKIRKVLRHVYQDGFKDDDVGFECESGGCDGANAYVYDFWSDIHLCSSFFDKSYRRQSAIIVHEMTHEYAETDDEFYYALPASPLARDEETTTLRNNADTYEEFLLENYIP